jgi:hypothetical protein
MGGQHREGPFHRLEEQHQDLVPGGIVVDRRATPPLLGIPERRLVPMVAVRKRDRRRPESLGHAADRFVAGLVSTEGNHPEPVPDAVAVGELGYRPRRCRRGQPVRHEARRVVAQPDDRARVDARRSEESIAVLARFGKGSLVRANPASVPERLQPDPREDPASRRGAIGPRERVGLFVRVEGRPWIPPKRPVRAPGGHQVGGAPVALVGLVAGLLLGEVEPDDVA